MIIIINIILKIKDCKGNNNIISSNNNDNL